jgi:hypothetical protein
MIRTATIPVTTSGADGVATGEAYSDYPLNGELAMLVVDWAGTAPAGTSDIAVTVEADGQHPAVALYSKENAATDVTLYPVKQAAGTDGVLIADVYARIPVAGRIKVAVAGCNALAPAATVYVCVKE